MFKGDFRAIIGPIMASTDNAKAGVSDTKAFLDYLASRPDVKGKVGTVGFCMGGGMALTAAGTYPDRVAAPIRFHGGNLASADSPLSPHLLAPKMRKPRSMWPAPITTTAIRPRWRSVWKRR